MNGTMKSLIVDPDGSLRFAQVPIPEIKDTEALVKIEACGVCNGTDGKLIHRAFKGVEIDEYPLILGHEAVGTVVEVGAKAKRYKVGDRVFLPYVNPVGEYGSAWGAFSEYGVVVDMQAMLESGITMDSPDFYSNCPAQTVIQRDIDPIEAVVIITLREVLASTRFFGAKPGETVVVFGCGPVGLTFIKFLKLMGIGPVVGLDIVDEKLESAKANGADYVFNSMDASYVEKIRELFPNGVDYVFDASGALRIINESMALIKDRGKICCYGISPDMTMQLDWSKADYNWQLIFQQMPRKIEEAQAESQIYAWMDAGVIDLKEWISDVYSFDEAIEVFAKLERKEIAKKCVLDFRK